MKEGPDEHDFALLSMLAFAHQRSDADHDTLELVDRAKKPLENLCEQMLNSRANLEHLGLQLSETFSDNEAVHASLQHEHGGLGFFPRSHQFISDVITGIINEYVKIATEYELRVKGKLERLQDYISEGERTSPLSGASTGNKQVTFRAAKAAKDIFNRSTSHYITSKNSLHEMLKEVRKFFVAYDKYLRDRFIKSDDRKTQQPLIRISRDGHEEPQTQYIKAKLYDGNPVLTDVLLRLVDALPEYKELMGVKSRKKWQETRTLSRFAVEDMAEKLAALSDEKLLSYLEKPNEFFNLTGTVMEPFYKIFLELENYTRALFKIPDARVMTNEPELMRKMLADNGSKAKTEIERLKRIDLDSIVQNPDDVSPDNRTETEMFRYRERLFDILYNGMKQLSVLDTNERRDKAEVIIREAVDIKYQMKLATMTLKKRRLRQDKMSDNEYYVGRMGEYGQFHFERKPTPEVRIYEVIGASFDVAKSHLNDIIETGSYSRLMSITAPGGKVRSNILLIGPYGCGKTELGRAVCADERVIGTSVSVANTLTAFMHESVANVKRIYDSAVELRDNARDMKPVLLTLDEFNGWFTRSGNGTFADTDMQQIENIFLEVLDGMENYSGIITMAMTNKPLEIPHGVVRRFRYVDIVGQLTQAERKSLLSMYLEKRLPVAEGIAQNYDAWARKLDDAPGDVVRKVIDEVHFGLIPAFIKQNERLEKVLYNREVKNGRPSDEDIAYVKVQLQKYGCIATAEQVGTALDGILQKPHIKMQISDAKEVYKDARQLMEELSHARSPYGLKPRDKIFEVGNS